VFETGGHEIPEDQIRERKTQPRIRNPLRQAASFVPRSRSRSPSLQQGMLRCRFMRLCGHRLVVCRHTSPTPLPVTLPPAHSQLAISCHSSASAELG
jgi:hypothetical protein